MEVFVDTSAWFALIDRSDQHHLAAVAFLEEWRERSFLMFTSDYVVDETVTLLARRVARRKAIAFLDSLKTSEQVVLQLTSGPIFSDAEQMFRVHNDKSWSFTDCVSFVHMDRLGLSNAFAFDRHFAQYGKICHPVF